jgi:hypothetical protein
MTLPHLEMFHSLLELLLPLNISMSITANKSLTTDNAWFAGLNFIIPLGQRLHIFFKQQQTKWG